MFLLHEQYARQGFTQGILVQASWEQLQLGQNFRVCGLNCNSIEYSEL